MSADNTKRPNHKFQTTGSVNNMKREVNRPVRSEDTEASGV